MNIASLLCFSKSILSQTLGLGSPHPYRPHASVCRFNACVSPSACLKEIICTLAISRLYVCTSVPVFAYTPLPPQPKPWATGWCESIRQIPPTTCNRCSLWSYSCDDNSSAFPQRSFKSMNMLVGRPHQLLISWLLMLRIAQMNCSNNCRCPHQVNKDHFTSRTIC